MKKLWWGIFFGSLVGVFIFAPESNFSNRVHKVFSTFQELLATVFDENPELAHYVMIFLGFNIFLFISFNFFFIRGKITSWQILGITIKLVLELLEFMIGILKEDMSVLYISYLPISIFYIPLSIFLINFLMDNGSINPKMLLTTFIDSALAYELLFIGLMINSLAR